MKTKVVYVLCSDDADIYLEQTLLSVFSLRMYNPDVYVELVLDKRTEKTLQGKRVGIFKYISCKNVVVVPDNYNKIQASRWLKTSLKKHVEGDFLFIDSDTVITGSLDDVFDFVGNVGAVADGHVNMGCTPFNYNLRSLSKQDGWTFNESLPYYNSGVLLVRDSDISSKLYDRWHSRWIEGVENNNHISDQSYLAASDEELGYVIRPLDGIWNCQIARNGLPYLEAAKIIHMLGFSFHSLCPPWAFYDLSIYQEIKECGSVTWRVSDMLKHAKSAFPKINGIVADDEVVISRSRLFRFLVRHKWIVSSFEKFSHFIK